VSGFGVAGVVPTLGRSPLLVPCLEALRRSGAHPIVLVTQAVDQGRYAALSELVDQRVDLGEAARGFAIATNAGLACTTSAWVAVVNDDAIVAPDWLELLLAAASAPGVGSLQGRNVVAGGTVASGTVAGGTVAGGTVGSPGSWGPGARDAPIDGLGIGWNRWWQAVQLGRGHASLASIEESFEVFGVSATAALYRREALDAVIAADGTAFDAELDTYYEDVDLAGRLRARGWRALVVPTALVRHAGSLSAPAGARRRLYRNRWLVLARLLGRRLATVAPRALGRDLVDLARGNVALDELALAWLGALRRAPRFARAGAPLLERRVLDRLRAERIENERGLRPPAEKSP
jgi:GT2 family glycosyltransferase